MIVTSFAIMCYDIDVLFEATKTLYMPEDLYYRVIP
jgi:hypothetical protein